MRRTKDNLFTLVAAASAAGAAAILVALIAFVSFRGLGAISFDFLSADSAEAGASGGIVYHILGTLILIASAAAIAVPVSAGTAIFSHSYADAPRLRRSLDSLVHALNAVPSIVFGLFGLVVFVRLGGMNKSWLAGGIILAMMIVPTITVTFLERLRAIPSSTIEAAAGLGLSRGEIVRTVLVPQSVSALVTGTLLGLARAAGETAPIMFTAVIFSGATIPRGIVDSPVLALPYHIFVLAQDTFAAGAEQRMWGAAVVLLLIVGTLSVISLPLRLRAHEEARRD